MSPPVMSVRVETTMDIMIARNTARRAAGLLGFNPAHQAQLASASATVAELVMKTNTVHTLHINGITSEEKKGIQLSIAMPWLTGVASGNVMIALRSKLGDLVDEIMIEDESSPTVILVMWITEADLNDAEDDADQPE